MYEDLSTIILNYLETNARNKIIFYQNDIPGIEPIDIGKEVSERISTIVNDGKLSFKAKLIIDEIQKSSIANHEIYGTHIAISNIGILFEPDLKIDIIRLFERFSYDNALFVKWYGEIESGTLFFLSKQSGIKLEFKTISHIII